MKVSIDGKGKKEVDYLFIELKHKDHKDVVYYKQLSSFLNGAYTFTNIELDQTTMLKGDYSITLVVVDDYLWTEHRETIGSIS